MTDYVKWGEDGVLHLIPSDQLTPAQRYAIESISEDPAISGEKMSKDRALKIKLRDPQPSMTNIGRVHGLLPMPGGARVGATAGQGRTMVEIDDDEEMGTVVLILPDNGRGDGPPPLPPLPPKLS
jgi:hypothetical protein